MQALTGQALPSGVGSSVVAGDIVLGRAAGSGADDGVGVSMTIPARGWSDCKREGQISAVEEWNIRDKYAFPVFDCPVLSFSVWLPGLMDRPGDAWLEASPSRFGCDPEEGAAMNVKWFNHYPSRLHTDAPSTTTTTTTTTILLPRAPPGNTNLRLCG